MNGQPAPGAMARIGAIWADVLGLDSVSPSDHFFSLGGNEETATLMVAQVEHALDRMLSSEILHDAPTLETFTEAVVRWGGGS